MTEGEPISSQSDHDRPSARYRRAVDFLAKRIDYERTHAMPNSEEGMKLDRMRELLGRLGNPQVGLSIVHVAGTKGKGSTAAMIAGVLTAAGFPTGLFTSPHLERIEERIAIDAQPCSPETFADLVEAVRPAVEAMDRGQGSGGDCPDFCVSKNGTVPFHGTVVSLTTKFGTGLPGAGGQGAGASRADPLGPTYFEILTAMAFCHFARRAKIAVLEVGLGGRLDSTNVCAPLVSVITSISLDHTRQLGETLVAIAAEKAGIIKPGVPVVSGVTDPEPRKIIRRIAAAQGCRLLELGVDFDFRYDPPRHLERSASAARFELIEPSSGVGRRWCGGQACASLPAEQPFRPEARFTLGLLGRHQSANATVALMAVRELRRAGWAIPEPAVRRGWPS